MKSGSPDAAAVARLHERLISAIWRELRTACQMHSVEYPELAEREIREYYRREMGWDVAP